MSHSNVNHSACRRCDRLICCSGMQNPSIIIAEVSQTSSIPRMETCGCRETKEDALVCAANREIEEKKIPLISGNSSVQYIDDRAPADANFLYPQNYEVRIHISDPNGVLQEIDPKELTLDEKSKLIADSASRLDLITRLSSEPLSAKVDCRNCAHETPLSSLLTAALAKAVQINQTSQALQIVIERIIQQQGLANRTKYEFNQWQLDSEEKSQLTGKLDLEILIDGLKRGLSEKISQISPSIGMSTCKACENKKVKPIRAERSSPVGRANCEDCGSKIKDLTRECQFILIMEIVLGR